MKDASFLPALPVILQKQPLLKPLAKTSQPLARKLNFTALFHINATCPWNAQITASVFMTGNAPLTVLSAFPLNVPAETGFPESCNQSCRLRPLKKVWWQNFSGCG